MNTPKLGNIFSLRYPAVLVAVIFFGCSVASAQKPSKPAAPAKSPAPAKPAGAAHPTAAGAHPTAAGAAHGPTTAGASRGPTTSNPGGHGVTTANAGRGATTANVGRGATTAGGRPGMGTNAGRGPMGGGARPAARPMVGGHPVARDNHVMRARNGGEVRMRANGRPGDVHLANRGMDIHHGLNGSRRVEVMRADHSRIVAERGGRGFVERPYRYGGRDFAHRTYYYHGRAYDHYYGHYYYHGAYVDYYTPALYYRPAFYGWAYNPWVAPVPYAWGWAGNPWYGYYGYYFTPYAAYPSASAWLTDYMISTGLAAAYEAQAQAAAQAAANNAPPPDAAPLSPQVKDLISQEVQRQIALENSEAQAAQTSATDPASSSVQRMLTDNIQHVFVAGRDLDVVDASGTECAISAGDALQLAGPPPADATAANLVMLSSKGGQECRRGVTVSVNIPDLQEMQNHMRETIDQGMADMQAKQGKGGLPAIPASAAGAPVKAAFTAGAPGPDANAATEISQEAQQADQAEKETLAQVEQPSGPGPNAPAEQVPAPIAAPAPAPATLTLGQSIDEVTAIEGTPKSIVDLGAKKIYVFNDGMKVTFRNGKSTDVQ